jgi:hypothetical protein
VLRCPAARKRRAEILEVKKGITTMNEYEIPEVVEVDRAKNAILGAKRPGGPDDLNGSEVTEVFIPETDIDE